MEIPKRNSAREFYANRETIFGPQKLRHDQVLAVLGLTNDGQREYPNMPQANRLTVSIIDNGELTDIVDCSALYTGGPNRETVIKNLSKYGLTPDMVLGMFSE